MGSLSSRHSGEGRKPVVFKTRTPERVTQPGSGLRRNDGEKEVTLSPSLLPLLRELGDLKRIRSAGRQGSIATRLFETAWQALMAGAAPARIMAATVASALAAARLGDLDAAKLDELGLLHGEARKVLEAAFDEIASDLDPALAATLRGALGDALPAAAAPRFVALLAEQPRAGVTCPGRPRIMLQPEENHAEHCLVVAVYGVVVAPAYGSDQTAVFLAALGHHLHSAAMPDSGYTGEVLLGECLDAVIANARAQALAQLPADLASVIEAAVAPLGDAATPEARAFHAADVIDRVLEIEQHLKVSRLTMRVVTDDYGLVHDGPVKAFHDQVLAGIGLP